MCRARDVPHAAAWPRVIPVEHHGWLVLAKDRVVRRPVVVADELMRARRDLMPSGARWRPERQDGIVIAAEQLGGAPQRGDVFEHPSRHRLGPSAVYVTRQIREYRAAAFVKAQAPRRGGESDGFKVRQKRLDRWRPRAGPPSHGVADSDRLTEVSAERDLRLDDG